MEQPVKRIIEGPPIFIESLMSEAEYKENHKKFPNTNLRTKFQHTIGDFDVNEFRWRYQMGANFTVDEVNQYRKTFEKVIRILREKYTETAESA